MAQRGRKAKHHVTDNGTTITGLIKQRDGRWRILATGERFTAPSEAEAIAKFKQRTKPDDVPVPVVTETTHTPGSNKIFERTRTPGEDFWPWLREFVVNNLHEIREKTGLRGLSLDLATVPQRAVKLADIRDLYAQKSDSNWRTKGQVKAAMNRLMETTQAKTLEDLTTGRLIQFREKLNEELEPTGAAAVHGKIKAAMSFAMKHGSLDNVQLADALARAKVLYASGAVSKSNPTPMSPADFRKLLAKADERWKAILLLGLNGALYAEDIAGLEWSHFDLAKATYSGIRAKTSIVRVMALWPETVAALRKLPRRAESPYVFTSQTGGRYLATTLYDSYKELRVAAGVVTPFSGLRDAAYTIACEHCDNTVARAFAAHKAPGLQDAYGLRAAGHHDNDL